MPVGVLRAQLARVSVADAVRSAGLAPVSRGRRQRLGRRRKQCCSKRAMRMRMRVR